MEPPSRLSQGPSARHAHRPKFVLLCHVQLEMDQLVFGQVRAEEVKPSPTHHGHTDSRGTACAEGGKDDEYHWGDNGSSGVVSPWPVAPPVPSHPSADYVPDDTNSNDDYNLCALARLERMPSGRLAPDSLESRCHSLLHAVCVRDRLLARCSDRG